MKSLIFIILFMAAVSCFGQTFPLSDFTETEAPAYGTKDWYALNYQPLGFSVRMVNGQLQISRDEPTVGFEYFIPEGLLKGVNSGEFGGGLFFKPNDSTKAYHINGKLPSPYQHYAENMYSLRLFPLGKYLKVDQLKQLVPLGGSNPQTIFKYKDTLYVIDESGNVMAGAMGLIYSVDLKGDNFTISDKYKFKDPVTAIAIKSDTLMFATYKGFYVISNNKQEMVMDNLFWVGLYPNSIAVADKNTIYVGMRGGYVKLNLQTRDMVFYKYNK